MPTGAHDQGAERADEHYEWPLAVALRIPAEAASLKEVRGAVRGFMAELPFDPARRRAAELAANEAASNVVRHAYPDGAEGPIELEADFENGSVELIIRDHGQGIQPGSAGQPGVGLKLIAALTDDFSISETENGGVEVWMRLLCS